MEITKKTFIDNIIDRSQENLSISAFENLGGTSINYDNYFKLINIYAKAFKEIGVQNGDCVTLCTLGTLDTMLYCAALNKIGAVINLTNYNYLKSNGKKYIDDTKTSLLICMDRFYPVIKNELAKTNINKILISSISEYSSLLYKIILHKQSIKNEDKIEGVEYINLSDFLKLGNNSQIVLNKIPYEKDKPAVISYTSGTTGDPKGVVHTNDSINNMISIYAMTNGFGPNRGDRNLVLIPPMYLTSFIHSLFGTMILGLTNILQPIYNPLTFGKDLKKYEPITTVASKSHYINLRNSNLKKDSLSFLKYPYCGGEAFSKESVEKINEILKYYGIPPMILGYGQTEFGTMTMFNSDIPTRTNESGILIPTINAKILDLQTGQKVNNGERGELYIQTPAIMKEYLNNPEATSKFFVEDETGKWGKTGDIASVIGIHDNKEVYEIYGRKSDSFIDENGNIVYLFDIENLIEKIDDVKEAEVISYDINGKNVPIVHFILEQGKEDKAYDTIKLIESLIKKNYKNSSYIPYAYKVRDSFSVSPVTGKRDYSILKYDTDDFYKLNNNEIVPISLKNTKVKKLTKE